MAFSVGIGLTNECDLRCPHCYRPDATVDRLSLQAVRRVCDAIPIGSMNLGVGENGLHPEYRAVLDYLADRRIKTSITSNGASIACLTDAEVKRFNSIEFSLDFPTEAQHDAFRGAGNWRHVHAGLERCQSLGVPVGITTVLMRINARGIPALVDVAGRLRLAWRRCSLSIGYGPIRRPTWIWTPHSPTWRSRTHPRTDRTWA